MFIITNNNHFPPPSLNHHLTVVKGFVLPNDPGNRSQVLGLIKGGSSTIMMTNITAMMVLLEPGLGSGLAERHWLAGFLPTGPSLPQL